MAAVQAQVEVSTKGWSGMLTEAVVKCGRDSERLLYMYGISSTRCHKCKARLRPGIKACILCHYEHKTLRKCMRCSQKNDPVMWCAECDAYFCTHCHKKPHVLMLESLKPHHCFAIDSASGKHLVEASWSDEFIKMVRATYQMRSHDHTQIDEATGQQTAANVEEAECPTIPAAKVSSTADRLTTCTDVHEASEESSIEPATGSPTAEAQKLSQKRQLSKLDNGRGKKSARVDESLQSSGNSTALTIDSMGLYDRVMAMHDVRAKATHANAVHTHSPKSTIYKPLSQHIEKHGQQKAVVEIMHDRDILLQQQQEKHRHQEVTRVKLSNEEPKRLGQEIVETQHSLGQLQPIKGRLKEEQKGRQEEEKWQQGDERQQEERRQQDILHQIGELHRQDKIEEEQRHKHLIDEQVCHKETMRKQDARWQAAARPLELKEGSYFSQRQQILRTQPGFAAASKACTNSSAPVLQGPNTRVTKISSLVNLPKHAKSAFASPTAQDLSFQSTNNAFVSTSIGNENESQFHLETFVTSARGSALVSSFENFSQDHDGNHHLVVRNPEAWPQYQPPGFSDTINLHRTTAVGDECFNARKAGENDELRAIWVSDYDSINALIMQLDVEIMKRTEEGHKFVHRSNKITIPEQLKMQLHSLRARRDAAMKKRIESVVRVLIFSEAVRSFAQQNEHVDIWSDVPTVLRSSHKKCAELATTIRKLEGQAQRLRNGIDKAVSSGDPSEMQHVAQLGALIADLEQNIRVTNDERDKQFIFMFQFSSTLRNIVRNEWAASVGYHLSLSKKSLNL